MKKIKAYTSMDECNKIHRYRDFKIVDSIPTIGEEFGYHFGDRVKETVKQVIQIELDIEQGSYEVDNYNYYKVVTIWNDEIEEEIEEKSYYYAVAK